MMSSPSPSQDSTISPSQVPSALANLSPKENAKRAAQWWKENQLEVLHKIVTSKDPLLLPTLPIGLSLRTNTQSSVRTLATHRQIEDWDKDLYRPSLPQIEEEQDNIRSGIEFDNHYDSDTDSIELSENEHSIENMTEGDNQTVQGAEGGTTGTTNPASTQSPPVMPKHDSVARDPFDGKIKHTEDLPRDAPRDRMQREPFGGFYMDPVQPYRELVHSLDNSMQQQETKWRSCMDKLTTSFRKANDREQHKVDKERFKQGLKNINKSDGILSLEVERTLDDIDLALKQFSNARDKVEASKYFITQAASGDLLRQVLKFLEDPVILKDYTWANLREAIFKAFIANDPFEEHFRKLENMQIIPGETIPAFTRRFLFQVDKTYTEDPRTEELDKYLLKLFLKALKNENLVQMMFSTIDPPQTIMDGVIVAEKIYNNLAKMKSYGVSPVDRTEFATVDIKNDINKIKVEQSRSLEKMGKQLDYNVSKLAKMDLQLKKQMTGFHDQVSRFQNRVNHATAEMAAMEMVDTPHQGTFTPRPPFRPRGRGHPIPQ